LARGEVEDLSSAGIVETCAMCFGDDDGGGGNAGVHEVLVGARPEGVDYIKGSGFWCGDCFSSGHCG